MANIDSLFRDPKSKAFNYQEYVKALVYFNPETREQINEAHVQKMVANRIDKLLEQEYNPNMGNKFVQKDNPEKVKEQVKAWVKANPEKIKGYMKKASKAWHERNPDYQSNFYKAHKERYVAARARRRAAQESATPSWLTAIDKAMIQEMYDVSEARYIQTGIKHHVDHIVPINGKGVAGMHVPWNLQVITAHENLSKGWRF
jgi:hypothetical protein